MIQLLLVEDNPDDEALFRRAVKSRQLDAVVQVAKDGQEAVEMLGIDDLPLPVDLPHAIILDLKLPKLSGHEVLERLRSHEGSAHIPVLILSSSDEPTDVKVGEKLGAQYVRKPVDYDEFLSQVGEALEQLVIRLDQFC